jgi:hypothetical protein
LTKWRKWDTELETTDFTVRSWLSGEKTGDSGTRWLFLEQHCNLELLTENSPILSFDKLVKYTSVIKEKCRLYSFSEENCIENKATFLAAEKYIITHLLGRHRHCIDQIWELRKEENSNFPVICPYAYAFVFWRASLLKSERFYKINPRSHDLPQTRTPSLATKLISDELLYLKDQYLRQTSGEPERESALTWMLNRVTAAFCLSFFRAWLGIAEEGARKEVVPSWLEIEELKRTSFPKICFKYRIPLKGNTIEYIISRQNQSADFDFECPNQSASRRKKIKLVKSYTPQRVAMMVFNKSLVRDKQLQTYLEWYVTKQKKYVDSYVSKLTF